MGRSDKIPLSVTSFPQVAEAIATVFRILDVYDLDALHAALSDRDGTLSFRDPTLFLKIQADPQWQRKCDLVEAAAKFTRSVSAIISGLEAE